MTTRTHAQRVSVPAYYLGRPAALWVVALAPRPATQTPPHGSSHPGPLPCEQHIRSAVAPDSAVA